jgi:hypothetical protein
VVQELVNNYDYSSGGVIQIMLENNSSISQAEFEGLTFESGNVPVLYITYTVD